MADADVPITAGAGTKIDTRTVGAGTDEHRQVVVVGDPTTAANVQAVSAAGAAKVDGSAVTQPVSLAAAVAIGAGAAVIGTVLNVGDVDHDAVNTGKAVQVAGHASPNTTPPAAVSAAGDRVRAWYDLNGASIIRPRKLITYRAVYRTTTAPYALSQALVASTRKQFATIHHAASATKTVRVKGAWFLLSSTNVGALTAIDFIRITAAPATGNPAITPQPSDPADAAAEATCLTLPTTAGTEVAVGSVYSSRLASGGVSAAPTNPNDIAVTAMDLLQMGSGNEYDHENKAPVIRAGVLEGWAVTLVSTGAPTVGGIVIIDFTEE